MSPDELLWNAHILDNMDAVQQETVVDHLVLRLQEYLRTELQRDTNTCIDDNGPFGFSVDFWSVRPSLQPLCVRVRGVFGASILEGRYVGVQGWLYPYIQDHRVATTSQGNNHIFLRYAKSDAEDNDWEMMGCSGIGEWRSIGWSPDTYGEFDGQDLWHDVATS